MKKIWLIFSLVAAAPLLRGAVMTDEELGLTLTDAPRLLVETPHMFAENARLPASGDTTMVRGVVGMLRATNDVEGLQALEHTLDGDPRNADLLVARAWLFTRQKKFEAALDVARQAKLVLPDDPTPDLLAGYCFHALGRARDAQLAYEDALRYPSAPLADIQENIGVLLMTQHDATNALPHFRDAVRLEPQSASALNNYGTALADIGKIKESRGNFCRAVQSDPQAPDAWHNLVKILNRLDGPSAADDPRQPKDVLARRHDEEAVRLRDAGDPAAALAQALRATFLAPDNMDFINLTARLLFQTGHKEDAVAFKRRADALLIPIPPAASEHP